MSIGTDTSTPLPAGGGAHAGSAPSPDAPVAIEKLCHVRLGLADPDAAARFLAGTVGQIGRASCRER